MTFAPAPVEDRIVVSEIGEAWSPRTAPASTAPKAGSNNSGWSTDVMIAPAIGSSSPNEPQEVPVAKAIREATRNITGTSQAGDMFAPSTNSPRYSPVPSAPMRSPSIQARSRIAIAGSIDLMPSHQPRPNVALANSGFLLVLRR